MSMLIKAVLAGLLSVVAAGVCASEQGEVVRYPMQGTDFPIASAVEVPASANMVFFSGNVPPLTEQTRGDQQVKAYAVDTEGQTVDVLKTIERNMQRMGLGIGDVIKMQVYLVGDPKHAGKMDFAGFMRGYTQFFGTSEQPNLPARSVFQVAGLADPNWLVEIEVIAVRPATKGK